MATTRKSIVVFVAAVGLWFLAADAYWRSKERTVENCTLSNAVELLKGISKELPLSDSESSRSTIYLTQRIVREACWLTEGGGNWWDSVRGMAYWEVVLLAPIAYRFRFE